MEGCIATIPPNWPPSAVTAARCTAGETVVRTRRRRLGVAVASTRVPPRLCAAASSSPPGVPRRRASSASSSPLTPTIAFARHAFGFERCAPCGRDRPDGARRPRSRPRRAARLRCPRVRAPRLRRARCRRGPAASRARGSVVWRLSSSPGCRPGNASERDQAIRVPRAAALHRQREVARERSEQARLHAHRAPRRHRADAAGLAGHLHASRGTVAVVSAPW